MSVTVMSVKDVYDKVQSGEIISDINLQREIVYSLDKQVLVIDSIVVGVPLPAFYFWQNESGDYEVLDGKQRIEAISKFLNNDLEYNGNNRRKTDIDTQNVILNTELSVIICSGDEDLKRKIFNRINTLGVPLSNFEVLNGLYSGDYLDGLTDYCRQPIVTQCLGSNSRGNNQYRLLGYIIKRDYKKLNHKNLYDYTENHASDEFSIDQDYVDKRLKFIKDVFDNPKKHIDTYWYLADKYLRDKSIWVAHKRDMNAALNEYYSSDLYKLSSRKQDDIEEICLGYTSGLTLDPQRTFTDAQKEEFIRTSAIKNPDGTKCQCSMCESAFKAGEISEDATFFYPNELEMDHIIAWSKGGKTVLSNAQLLCRPHNIQKSDKDLGKI